MQSHKQPRVTVASKTHVRDQLLVILRHFLQNIDQLNVGLATTLTFFFSAPTGPELALQVQIPSPVFFFGL